LAPFFLDHYSFADEIVVLISDETIDNTEKIVRKYKNTKIRKFYYSEKFSCKESTDIINEYASEMATDWIMVPDADEFVFPPDGMDVREALKQADGTLIYADMWMVYRHRTELDLDPSLKAMWLRRHGDPNRDEGENARYKKPIIVRSGLGIKWGVGLHNYEPNPKIIESNLRFDGAHWMMADPDLAVKRRLRGRKELVAQENLDNLWSCNNFDITEEEIREECKRHLDDPQLF
jgi:glycosyltransferase involved in cell wall biosynthesis